MPILSHHPAHERDHAPASVAFVRPDQTTPSPAAPVDRRAAALAQRAELHLDLSDDLLRSLAAVSAIVGTGVRS